MKVNNLDPSQQDAACHAFGPALVLAGPGSGKTKTLLARIQYLLEQGMAKPSEILVITYTKEAAKSMQNRFLEENQLSQTSIFFSTFHALFFHILKKEYSLKTDCLLTRKEKEYFLSSLLKKYQLSPDLEEEFLAAVGLYKNGADMNRLPLFMQVDEAIFQVILREYCDNTKRRGKLDFDDMLYQCKTLFEEHKEVLETWQKRFRFILVDEFQDTNKLQYDLVKQLSVGHRNLYVVGDDDQAIYGFRGAYPGIMKRFLEDYPDAGRYQLNRNYRSCKEIVDASNLIIEENNNRMEKHMVSDGMESEYRPVTIFSATEIIEEYQMIRQNLIWFHEKKGIPYEEMAVVFRTNREIEMFAIYLEEKNILCEIVGNRRNPYQHFIAQDLQAYLHLIAGNYRRQYFLRVCRDVLGDEIREILQEEWVVPELLLNTLRQEGRVREAEKFTLFLRKCKTCRELSPPLAISFVRKMFGYEEYIKRKAGEEELYRGYEKIADFLQMKAGSFSNIAEFLTFLEQEENSIKRGGKMGAKGKVKEDGKELKKGVHLMTMHAAKGLEFTYVAIPNVNEGRIPHGRNLTEEDIEEERRLFYVGMTRAKRVLQIFYVTGTKESERPSSRFLDCLTDYTSSDSTSSSNS